MKVNIKYSNNIKFLLNPRVNNIVLLKPYEFYYNSIEPAIGMAQWCNTKVTIIKIFTSALKIKENNEKWI